MNTSLSETPVLGSRPLSLEEVVTISDGVGVRLSDVPGYRERIERGAAFVDRLLAEEGEIYGVTTGYGDSCSVGVPLDLARQLPIHLSRYHGCGLGEHFSPAETRAVLAARLASLAQGESNKEIARKLDLAESTVKIHVQNIFKKLNMSSRVQVALYAVENGYGR